MASNGGDIDLHCLPTNEEDLQILKTQIKKEDERGLHLLKLVESSYKTNRPIGQTSILLVGRSGAGKSTFINNFFGNKKEICSSSTIAACSKMTTEYVVTSCSEQLGVRDLKLSCIDTPGFDDSGGQLQSVRNVLSTKAFFDSHPKYQLKQKTYPNIVLVVHNASDNRMGGHESKLAKVIKSLSTLDVIDKKHPNVLMVFTNACSVKGKDLKKESDGHEMFQTFGEVYDNATELFATYLKLKPPIYFVENMSKKLPDDGDWTILPCGTKQLYNVFEGMTNLLLENGDSLGAATVSHYFANRKEGDVTTEHVSEVAKGKRTQEKSLKKVLYPKENPDLNEVQKLIMANAENIIGEDKNIIETVARDFSKILTINGVETAADLTTKSLKEIADLVFPSPLTSMRQKIISGSCATKSNDLLATKPRIFVGQGFDIFKDQPLARDIYKFNQDRKQMTPFNMLLPEEIVVRSNKKETFICKVFTDIEAYHQFRLKMMGVECKIPSILTVDDIKSGCTVCPVGGADFKPEYFTQEHVEYSLSMNPYVDTLNPEFLQDVARLPNNFQEGETRQQFETFFAKWGHFVIIEVYCGGEMYGSLNKNIWKVDNVEVENLQTGGNILPFVETNTVKLDGGVMEDKHIIQENVFQNWLNSLQIAPTILKSRMKLKPIWECLQPLSLRDTEVAKKRDAIRHAQELILAMKTAIPETRETAASSIIESIIKKCGFVLSISVFTTLKDALPNLAMKGLCILEDISLLAALRDKPPDEIIPDIQLKDGLNA